MRVNEVVNDVKSKMVPGEERYLVVIYCYRDKRIVLENDREAEVTTYDLVGPVDDENIEFQIANELDRRGVNYNIRKINGRFYDDAIIVCKDLADWFRSKGF